MNDAPSGYRVEQALSAWQSTRARLLSEDADLVRDESALQELLGAETEDVRDILARLLRGAVHARAMMESCENLIEDMEKRRARYSHRAESMRATAYAIMDVLGEKKIVLPDLTASITKVRDSVRIIDVDAIPDIYVEVVTTRKPDKAVLRSALESGKEIPGVTMNNGLTALTIRTK